MSNEEERPREQAVDDSLNDILSMFSAMPQSGERRSTKRPPAEMDPKKLLALLDKNFNRLDLNGDGISRDELAEALAKPDQFSDDEYLMIQLLSHYFHTLANLNNDQAGNDTRITRADQDILKKALIEKGMTLKTLRIWSATAKEDEMPDRLPPPPLSGR